MICKASLRRVISLSLCLLVLVPFALADTIKLKDGSTVKGRIIGFRDGKFTIEVGDGTRRREYAFDADEVDSVEFDRNGTVAAAVTRPVSNTSQPAEKDPVIIEEPKPKPPPVVVTETKSEAKVPSTASAKPITLTIKVLADETANGWTNSGWVVKKGQKIKISAEGEVSLGKGNKVGAAGSYSLEDGEKLLRSVPTGALLAVIGDDNNDFIFVGSNREFVATRDGTLFLGLNEGNLKDNAGSFTVTIEIATDR